MFQALVDARIERREKIVSDDEESTIDKFKKKLRWSKNEKLV